VSLHGCARGVRVAALDRLQDYDMFVERKWDGIGKMENF
jgi:hypothetical protein